MISPFEALAHPMRRAILQLLKGGSRSAGELGQALGVPGPTMSGHFAKLRQADLIQAEQRGTTIRYSLNLSVLEEALMGFMEAVGAGKESKGDAQERGDRIGAADPGDGGSGRGGGGAAAA